MHSSLNRTTRKFLSSSVRKYVATDDSLAHFRKLGEMYRGAPVSGCINAHEGLEYDLAGKFPSAVLRMEAKEFLNHPGGSMHGVGYFKLLDDAAWFTGQALINDNFIFTTSFTVYITRPVVAGTALVAKGNIINASKSLIVAESIIEEELTGKLVAKGSGTFMRGPVPLSTIPGYVNG